MSVNFKLTNDPNPSDKDIEKERTFGNEVERMFRGHVVRTVAQGKMPSIGKCILVYGSNVP
ncbi:13600_t:CDS:2 [Acaulospora morrowiae]|uniref:13600_t:CDS:1 n=1 Tax=Acaulospora morrowiae TaxID=94023 RepID=A0A9N8VWW9_9GLOM|nr:13600_t:CDS:2 [Acaulospora morrowiae]